MNKSLDKKNQKGSLAAVVLAAVLYGVNRVVYRAVRAVKESPEGREIGQGLSAGGCWRGTISAGRSRFLFAGGRIGGKRLSVLKDG